MDTQAIVQGTLNPDGTLSLDAKLSLPPGRVQVIVAPIPDLPADDALGQRMQQLWTKQRAAGLSPHSEAAVEAERRAVRDEWEERLRQMESIHEEARVLRERSS